MTEGPSSDLGTSPLNKWWLCPQLRGGCVPPFLWASLSSWGHLLSLPGTWGGSVCVCARLGHAALRASWRCVLCGPSLCQASVLCSSMYSIYVCALCVRKQFPVCVSVATVHVGGGG